jgi:hypothetical protein
MCCGKRLGNGGLENVCRNWSRKTKNRIRQ